MRTETIELYSFDELSEETKEKVLSLHRDTIDAVVDYDIVGDAFAEHLKMFGVSSFEWSCGEFYSQGGGACFVCDIDAKQLFDALFKFNSDYDLIKNLLEEEKIDLEISSVRCGRHNYYSHENTVKADVHCEELSDNLPENLSQLLDAFEDDVTEFIRANCIDLFEQLKSHYEFCTSDECVAEVLNSMGETFTKTGQVVHV